MGRTAKRVVSELWEKHFARLVLPGKDYLKSPMLKFNVLYGKLLDVVMFNWEENIGYINLMRDKNSYKILNQWELNHHPGFIPSRGIGIEVKKSHRKKGIGPALLSIGIGLAQLDFRAQNLPKFCVRGDGITNREKFYEEFGFRIEKDEKNKKTYAVYTDPNSVPEFKIKQA